MAVEESDAGASCEGEVDRAVEVVRLEAGVPVDVALTVLGQDRLSDQRGRSSGAAARVPEREADVLLPVGPEQMLGEHVELLRS